MERGLSTTEVNDIYRRYGSMLARRCRLFLRDDALAEDAVQELFSSLLRRGEGVRNAESPYRYLCRAAQRVSLDVLRSRKRVRSALPIEDVDVMGPSPGVDAVARRAVLESLERLADEERALAIMLFVDGLTQGEAADELGVSRVTVNKRAQSIREALRLDLESSPDLVPEVAP